VETIDEFEAERDQKRDEQQQERQVVRDFHSGGVDIGVNAVGREQDSGAHDAHENDRRQRIEAVFEIWAAARRLDRAGQCDVTHESSPSLNSSARTLLALCDRWMTAPRAVWASKRLDV
jgi:hypothetical protein